MDQESCGASSFEHGTVTGTLWQEGALGFAVRPQANAGAARIGKRPTSIFEVLHRRREGMFGGASGCWVPRSGRIPAGAVSAVKHKREIV